MLTIFDGLRDVDFGAVLFRFIMAMICGACIGLERSYKNRPAGFRTHMLVCVGATAASVTGIFIYLRLHMSTDVSRMAAQVVTGLGFLGAGTIIVTKKKRVKGLTTAAGLWSTGIVGLAIGAGFYEGALIATALILVTEICFTAVSQRLSRPRDFTLAIEYSDKAVLEQVVRQCRDARMMISNLQISRAGKAGALRYTATVSLRPIRNASPDDLILRLNGMTGVTSVEEL